MNRKRIAVVGAILFMIVFPASLIIVLPCLAGAALSLIWKQPERTTNQPTTGEESPRSACTSITAQVANAVKDKYPGYVWVNRQTVKQLATDSRSGGTWMIETKLHSLADRREDLTIELVFTNGVLSQIIEPLELEVEEQAESVFEPLIVENQAEEAPEDLVEEEVSEAIDPAEEVGEEVEEKEFAPHVKKMYAETHLQTMQKWLEAQCQAAYAQKTIMFEIPPEMLPERQLWETIREILVGDRYDFPDATLLPADLGIEVQIPLENKTEAVGIADESLVLNEPVEEADTELLPIEALVNIACQSCVDEDYVPCDSDVPPDMEEEELIYM